MRVLCVFGQHNYGDPARGEGYEYINFIPALRRLGHEVFFFESRYLRMYQDFGDLNRQFLRCVEIHQPDVIFSVLTHYEIWLETWCLLRDSGIAATVNWATDDSWKYNQFSRFLAPAFHAFATTYPSAYAMYHRDGIPRVLLTQWAASSENFLPPLPAASCSLSVSFVGTAHGQRPLWIERLRRRGVQVACFGHGWPRGTVDASEIPKIVNGSVISLNFANAALSWDGLLPRHTPQLKARTFEVPGAGGFLLSEWAPGIEMAYVPEREIVLFRDLDDLVSKIHYYLAHPQERDSIARSAYVRTCAQHTYDLRLSEVLAYALAMRERYFDNKRASPTGQIDWVAFAAALDRHRVTGVPKLLSSLLTKCCRLLWGRRRGPRAARRLVFELSWRLLGAHTYSAAGWPGRLFYLLS
jgi:spore maturation protein CgeB